MKETDSSKWIEQHTLCSAGYEFDSRSVSFEFAKILEKALLEMNNIIHRSKRFLAKNAPTILTCVGSAGVVATAVMAVNATPKAMRLIEAAEKENGEKLTTSEIIKVAGPAYIPSAAIGASTIACIVGANVLNKRQQASLLSAYAFLNNAYKEYKTKVAELYGEDADTKIKGEIAKDAYETRLYSSGKHLFWDSFSMRYFEADPEDVRRAEYMLNQMLSTHGAVSVNDFYDLLHIELIENGDEYGWSAIDHIDFDHYKETMDDGLEIYIISMPVEPVYNY